jgi:hypothetical protein
VKPSGNGRTLLNFSQQIIQSHERDLLGHPFKAIRVEQRKLVDARAKAKQEQLVLEIQARFSNMFRKSEKQITE